MKCIIYGSKGWIGSIFIKLMERRNIIWIAGESRLDSNDIYTELQTLKNKGYTHVLTCTGRTHGKIGDVEYPTIDYLEQEGKLVENIRDNLYGPIMMERACSSLDLHYTYLGTGCIFSYDDTHTVKDFTEEDNPNFFGSSYSIVKGFTDRLFQNKKVLNLRIRMPITSDNSTRNFIYKITHYEKICSISNSMSVLDDLIPIAINMMEKNIIGTWNFVNPGTISHNEILEMYRDIIDPKFTWKNFTIEEQSKILAAERSNNSLNTEKLQSLYPDIKPIKSSIKDILFRLSK